MKNCLISFRKKTEGTWSVRVDEEQADQGTSEEGSEEVIATNQSMCIKHSDAIDFSHFCNAIETFSKLTKR